MAFRSLSAIRAARSVLKGTERVVWDDLCLAADAAGQVFPRAATLAAWGAVSERSVRAALASLRRRGALHLEGHTSRGVCVYTLNPEALGPVEEDDAESAGVQNLQGGVQNLQGGGCRICRSPYLY